MLLRDYDGWTFPLPGGRVDAVFSSNGLEQQTFPACTQRSAAYSRPAASAFMLTRDESKRPPAAKPFPEIISGLANFFWPEYFYHSIITTRPASSVSACRAFASASSVDIEH
jgi:hypothetical protein